MVHLGNDWDTILADEWEKPYYQDLRYFLRVEYANQRIYPPMNDIFNALRYTSFGDTKVVIIGQDPYHGAGQAHGLCFSVQPGVTPPPSLKNMFKELHSDLGLPEPPTGELTHWARQGVLLLNTVLTVREGQPTSHQGKGWEVFTDAVIDALARERSNLVFILWGSYAQRKGAFIDRSRHCVIESAHPSPLSAHRGFFGSKPFSRANAYLEEHGIAPISW